MEFGAWLRRLRTAEPGSERKKHQNKKQKRLTDPPEPVGVHRPAREPSIVSVVCGHANRQRLFLGFELGLGVCVGGG
jgi:hypothetical protein